MNTTAEAVSPLSLVRQSYAVRFTTPAFLGDADQNGYWRTPPFKALLREWWRIAVAKEYGYDHRRLREAEGRLFGNAWLEPKNKQSQFCRSQVVLRLDSWESGKLVSAAWPGGPMESVVTTCDGKGCVRADVYMGYGPVIPPSRKENRPNIVIRNAIKPTSSDDPAPQLHIGFKPDQKTEINNALQLMQWFGAMGSRSRNGWGSLALEAISGTPTLSLAPPANDPLIVQISRSWQECLKNEWPHALGTEAGTPLIWTTEPKTNWREAMGCLANVKVEVRQAAKNLAGPDGIGGIHFLGYPAGGKWEIRKLGKEARLASQLRFKAIQTPKGWIGIVFHVPCRFPDVLRLNLSEMQRNWIAQNEQQVWRTIHDTLRRSRRLRSMF